MPPPPPLPFPLLLSIPPAEKFLNMGRFSDRLLVQNSMAFDLGLRAPKLDQVERLIMEMDKHFPIVVITGKYRLHE